MNNYKTKILSFQPGSIYQNGGMGRLLRRLYDGRESEVVCLTLNYGGNDRIGIINEIKVNVFPKHKNWMRWKLRNFFTFMRNRLFFGYNKNMILYTSMTIEFDVLHVINHGLYSAVLCDASVMKNKKLWTSFHDHYNLCSTFEDTRLLWVNSDRRLVISSELGLEYQRIFGDMSFEIITDGLYPQDVSNPKRINDNEIIIYFGGLLHIDYYELFTVLANAIDSIASDFTKIKLVLRGTQSLSFLRNRKFSVEYRDNFVSDIEIKDELDRADILYLPIKFSEPDFYLYSLSTKMIGYLGASGVILYHGPVDSAACKLLHKYDSAILFTTLNVECMIDKIKEIIFDKELSFQKSANAKKLSKHHFDLARLQNHFWNN